MTVAQKSSRSETFRDAVDAGAAGYIWFLGFLLQADLHVDTNNLKDSLLVSIQRSNQSLGNSSFQSSLQINSISREAYNCNWTGRSCQFLRALYAWTRTNWPENSWQGTSVHGTIVSFQLNISLDKPVTATVVWITDNYLKQQVRPDPRYGPRPVSCHNVEHEFCVNFSSSAKLYRGFDNKFLYAPRFFDIVLFKQLGQRRKRLSWKDASINCQKIGGNLPSLTNREQEKELIATLKLGLSGYCTGKIFLNLRNNNVRVKILVLKSFVLLVNFASCLFCFYL